MKKIIAVISLANTASLNIEKIDFDIDDTVTFNINNGKSYTRPIIDGKFKFNGELYSLSEAIKV